MSVHPLIQNYLDATAQEPKLPAIGIDTARKVFRHKAMSAAGANRTLPIAIDDHVIDGPSRTLSVRVYRESEAPGPALLFMHGGGFVLGDLDTHDGLCRELCYRAQCTVVAVDYGLAPEHPFPMAIDDALLACQWLREWDAIDQQSIAVGGDSAGAALAAALALQIRESGAGRLCGQLLIYPTLEPPRRDFPSYREMAEGYGLSLDGLLWFWEQYLQGQPVSTLAAPALADDHAGLPPALVMTAQYDVLRDEGEHYAELLKRAGNRVELKRYEGMTHGFLAFSHLIDEADQALEDAAYWLRLCFERSGGPSDAASFSSQ